MNKIWNEETFHVKPWTDLDSSQKKVPITKI